ncbi:MAG: SDR family oxidoreductase [Clostridia bacterium]|nr:SDR family oxidoreductase [Clostridia bacterium]
MKVVVTGGAGFIGSHIVDRLIEEGHDVVVVDNLSTGNVGQIRPEGEFYQLDITDAALEEVFAKERPQFVIHHAAQIDVQKSLEDPVLDASVNILGTVNLLNCCVKYEVGKVIYASTAAVYGVPQYLPIDENHPVGPISNYGISKYTPEQYLKVYQEMFGLNYTVLRYANVYGPRQGVKGEGGVICIFANKFLAGQAPFIFGDGSQTRDFVYVGDVVKANLAALEKGDGGVFNIGTGVQVSVNELLEQFKLLLGGSIEPVYEPPRAGDIRDSVFDVSRAAEVLDWQSEWSLEDGLRETVKYYQDGD